jgi:pathogenesis-related protein 1
MTRARSTPSILVALSALAVAASPLGCSSGAGTGGAVGARDSGGVGANHDDRGPAVDEAAAGGNSGGPASSSSGGTSGTADSSSDSGSSSSGSGDASSGGVSGAGRDAGEKQDASIDATHEDTAPEDAAAREDAPHDAAAPSVDGGLCSDESAWLVPMNASRAAVGVPPLVCDPIAAQVALNYANMCTYAHNANRNTDYAALGGAAGGVGENIAAGSPTEAIATAIASWINEESSYDYATNACAAGQMCGHYTQVVWKTTTAVGCAHVSCTMPNAALGGAPRWDFSVCDYSPPGNYIGQKPY